MPRVRTPERMDEPDVPREELDAALRFIRFVNRRLGGARALISCLRRWSRGWPRGEPITLLDVATGSADIPVAARAWALSRGHDLRITAIDSHDTTLDLARRHLDDQPAEIREGIAIEKHDALRLTDRFAPGSFDYAHAGMFLHHLDDLEAMTALRIMDRLSRRGVVWNDLARSPLARLGVRALTIGAPPIVRHDATVSVEAGFTRAEALELARRRARVGAIPAHVLRAAVCRHFRAPRRLGAGVSAGAAVDCAVIGAGPAGCAAAIGLASRGMRVVLVERTAFPRVKVCGEYISPAATGCLESLLSQAELLAAGARRVGVYALELDERCVEWRTPHDAWSLSRASLDDALVARARAEGVEVLQPVRVLGVVYAHDRASLSIAGRLSGSTPASWFTRTAPAVRSCGGHADASGRSGPRHYRPARARPRAGAHPRVRAPTSARSASRASSRPAR